VRPRSTQGRSPGHPLRGRRPAVPTSGTGWLQVTDRLQDIGPGPRRPQAEGDRRPARRSPSESAMGKISATASNWRWPAPGPASSAASPATASPDPRHRAGLEPGYRRRLPVRGQPAPTCSGHALSLTKSSTFTARCRPAPVSKHLEQLGRCQRSPACR
jgi:hypothetical protein